MTATPDPCAQKSARWAELAREGFIARIDHEASAVLKACPALSSDPALRDARAALAAPGDAAALLTEAERAKGPEARRARARAVAQLERETRAVLAEEARQRAPDMILAPGNAHVASREGTTITIGDLETGRETLRVSGARVLWAAPRVLVVILDEPPMTLRLIDPSTGAELHRVKTEAPSPDSFVVAGGSIAWATGGYQTILPHFFDVTTGRQRDGAPLPTEVCVFPPEVSPDGSMIGWTEHLVDVATGKGVYKRAVPHPPPVFSADGKWIADGHTILDAKTRKVVTTLRDPLGRCPLRHNEVTFGATHVGSGGHSACVWELPSGRLVRAWPTAPRNNKECMSSSCSLDFLAFTSGDRGFVAGGGDTTVIDLASGRELKFPDEVLRPRYLSSLGQSHYFTDHAGSAIYEVDIMLTRVKKLPLPEPHAALGDISGDGRLALRGGVDHAELIAIDQGKVLARLPTAIGVHFSADGTLVASGGGVFRARTGEAVLAPPREDRRCTVGERIVPLAACADRFGTR